LQAKQQLFMLLCLSLLKINFFVENQCKINFCFLCIDLKNFARRLTAGVNFYSAKMQIFKMPLARQAPQA